MAARHRAGILRAGIVGAGFIGEVHARAVRAVGGVVAADQMRFRKAILQGVHQRVGVAAELDRMTGLGFDILPGDHPIVPVMIGDAARATQMADRLLEKGIYVIGFSYPVVPVGKARIRTQVSAAHSKSDLERAVKAFIETREVVAR